MSNRGERRELKMYKEGWCPSFLKLTNQVGIVGTVGIIGTADVNRFSNHFKEPRRVGNEESSKWKYLSTEEV